jgi:hypothetical protein
MFRECFVTMRIAADSEGTALRQQSKWLSRDYKWTMIGVEALSHGCGQTTHPITIRLLMGSFTRGSCQRVVMQSCYHAQKMCSGRRPGHKQSGTHCTNACAHPWQQQLQGHTCYPQAAMAGRQGCRSPGQIIKPPRATQPTLHASGPSNQQHLSNGKKGAAGQSSTALGA